MLKETIPVFLQALMMNAITMRTSTAISKMLSVTEMIITGRMLPLSCPGVWVTVSNNILVILSPLKCIDQNLDTMH